MSIDDIRKTTVKNFGDQFHIFDEADDPYWAGNEHVSDLLGDVFDFSEIEDKEIAEVGSGSGRIVKILSNHNPKFFYSIEPSDSIDVIKKNNPFKELKIINKDGASFRIDKKIDFIFSLGVIHHIKDPKDVLENIFNHLKENGVFLCSVYAKENNKFLMVMLKLLRFCSKLDDKILMFISSLINFSLIPYMFFCKILPFNLPMKEYLLKRFSRNNFLNRKQIIFDQLNPLYAKFYSKKEIIDEIESVGFKVESTYDSAGNNWGIRAKKLAK